MTRELKGNIRQAKIKDLKVVKKITYQTIEEIYPHYYPRGAVDFFLAHHKEENIIRDIEEGIVFLLEEKEKIVGTVTIKVPDINRLFVLTEYQGKGYGRALLDFAEREISKNSEMICLDASLPAKAIYLKRGYKESESHAIKTENGDYLCYDIMQKLKLSRINYDGKTFTPKINSEKS